MAGCNTAETFANKYQGVFALDDKTFFTLKPITNILTKKGPVEVWMDNSLGFEIFNSSNESVAAVSLVEEGKSISTHQRP